jgi:hypothetical protein
VKHKHAEYKKDAASQADNAQIDWAKGRIASLNRRLGTDIGAKAERKRLNKIINPENK